MSEIEIKVTHKVSPDKTRCTYGGDFWGKDVCRYHTHRDRTHGRKAPKEKSLPKCTLFDKWLPGEYIKCEECRKACERVEGAEKTSEKMVIAVARFNLHIISENGIEIKDGNVFIVEYENEQVILKSKTGKKMCMDRDFFERNFMIM